MSFSSSNQHANHKKKDEQTKAQNYSALRNARSTASGPTTATTVAKKRQLQHHQHHQHNNNNKTHDNHKHPTPPHPQPQRLPTDPHRRAVAHLTCLAARKQPPA